MTFIQVLLISSNVWYMAWPYGRIKCKISFTCFNTKNFVLFCLENLQNLIYPLVIWYYINNKANVFKTLIFLMFKIFTIIWHLFVCLFCTLNFIKLFSFVSIIYWFTYFFFYYNSIRIQLSEWLFIWLMNIVIAIQHSNLYLSKIIIIDNYY